MERLTAFEFIPAQREGLHVVRLKRLEEPVLELAFAYWGALDLSALKLEFEKKTDLVIEGEGIGHPYWNDEATGWAHGFDPEEQVRRIETIRAAVQREVNRALVAVQ